ncbi:hypothetical protein AMS68_000742 [Peltaster fructicola]|uniref:Kelch repeat protein n=1 Tax=Peltaster fructicola TaxID=286661 RepID=A0A6H0XKS6_9PEZI|nr:hypothetical protein AMS68_000742 [Peltaster fructicola]
MRVLWLAAALQCLELSAGLYFHHKARHASVVIGKTLYIDGGEIAQWDQTGNGFSNGSTVSNAEDPNTYYIDLSTSWTATNATITSFPKNGPVLMSGALWSNTSERAFQYDGGISLAGALDPIPPNQLWALTPTGQSRWSQLSSAGNFSQLSRTQEGGYTSGNGLGFALGGYECVATIKDAADYYTPGLVMYNMSSSLWYNISTGGDYTVGTQGARTQLVTNFGTDGVGILVVLAGFTQQEAGIGLDRVNMFDPVTQQWRIQRTTGSIPQPNRNPCLVGVPGDNGTYELFMYGGQQRATGGWISSDGAVYILSLPAFHWFRVPGSAVGRTRHTCNIPSARSRQMISVGGIVMPGPLNSSDFTIENTGAPDPWANGLGVFDMTKLTWGSYVQPSDDYTTPDVVKDYYKTNGLYPSSWDDAGTQQWFTVKVATNSTSVANTSTSATPSAQSISQPAGISPGAIAGAVIGGIALIAVTAVAIWLFVRRRKSTEQQRNATFVSELGTEHVSEMEAKVSRHVQHYGKPRLGDGQIHELDHHRGMELDGEPKLRDEQIHELDHHRHELG